ncbi:MAG: DUF4339 domain-containing protein [Myxococcaceae bacterium]|nr:DUF4339 domain-containing protein [Myxococcaceae bacterium]
MTALTNDLEAPLFDASDTDINRLVDDVLRSGNQATMAEGEEAAPERYHARAIAEARRLAQRPAASVADEVDVWWFELQGKRVGPLSLKKLRLFWEDGELTPDTPTWREGMSGWVALFQVSELAEALTPKLDTKRVEDAAESFKQGASSEWGSPAGSAMQHANRTKLEAARVPTPAPLPVVAPVVDLEQHVASYRIHRDVEPEQKPRRGLSRAVTSGLVAGAIVTVAVVAERLVWPEGSAAGVQPIVINVVQPPAAVAAAAIPQAVVPAAGVAAVTAPKPAPVREKKVEAAPVAAPVAPKEPAKPETVDDTFAKTFASPDELTLGEVFEVVRANKAAVDECVKAQHAADAEAEGRLVMRWKVDTQGKVSGVNGAEDIPLAACLAKEIPSWSFPKHAHVLEQVEVPFKY